MVRAWADMYGMPVSYVVLDIETSGLNHDHDKVLQIGWCTVQNRRCQENAGIVIDHTVGMSDLELAMLKSRIDATAGKMKELGKQYGWSVSRIQEKGVSPKIAVNKLVEVTEPFDDVLAHYGIAFDYPMLSNLTKPINGFELPNLESGHIHDSALMYKACVARIRPRPRESYVSYISRIMDTRGPFKYSMATCITYFGLEAQGAVVRRSHDAIYDTWLAHLVYESIRNLAQ